VPWLTKQIEQRKLYEGNDHGRIWRIVSEQRAESEGQRVGLNKMTDAELVKMLGHPNGWQRNTAQRLLVERGNTEAVPLLEKVILKLNPPAMQMLHALWSLDGLKALKERHLAIALLHEDVRVRAAVARFSRGRLYSLLNHDEDPLVKLHAALAISAKGDHKTLPLLAEHLTHHEDDLNRIAVMTGLHGAETAMLDLLLKREDWQKESAHRRETLRLLTQLVGMDDQHGEVVARIGQTTNWQREALIDGFLATQPNDQRQIRPVTLKEKPKFLDELAADREIAARERVQRLRMCLTWPGAESAVTLNRKQPLSGAVQKQIERGAAVYQTVCGLCHQPTGYGIPNVAPPLAESEWATGEPERLIRIALHGLYGEIEVNGQKWNLAMPGQGANPALDDAKLADVLSYVRNAWGNEASVIEAAQVAAVREQTKTRKMPWTADTLMQVDVKGGNAIQADADGVLLLPASAAKTYGQKLAYRPSLNVLAPWRIDTDMAEWLIQVPTDGEYEVLVTLAADEASAGDAYVIEAETASVKAW
jgi:mono/diheme cytochrome c family protein